jgi:hypothetical protein
MTACNKKEGANEFVKRLPVDSVGFLSQGGVELKRLGFVSLDFRGFKFEFLWNLLRRRVS